MLRVIRSSIQGIDIDPDLADEYEEAIETAIKNRAVIRETNSLDELGQKTYRIALLPYTDPTGANRWAILDDGATESDWQDTDDLDEAIAAYEEWVRGATAGAMPTYDDEGYEKLLWDESDVKGIAAKNEYDGDSHNGTARMVDAEWAHLAFVAAEEAYRKDTQRRQIAFAKAVDTFGRGGQATLARNVDLKEPTVKTLADKGRQILAERAAAELPQVTVQHLRELLDSQNQEPVLYLKSDDDLELDVWAAAYVPSARIIIRQEELLDLLGEDRDDDSLNDQLDDLQNTVAEMAAAIKSEA
ncbi:hypothetical protein [Streptomyces sp. NPDC004579]|uniref:hypothetical protein n=1 Tax=Streptomyces sp. NPDC004579 TaxID=3154667 RepID=UPI0033A4B678